MKLKSLIKSLDVKQIIGDINVDVSDVKTDANSVTKGSVFIAINGTRYNGHDYVSLAEKYGAVAVICEKKTDANITCIIVEDTRKAVGLVASEFYDRPCDKLKFIGVTGTNGKTSTTHLITSVLKNNGEKCALIGTLGVFYGNKYIDSGLTTPDPLIFHKMLADMVDSGITTVVMEVSAHALYFYKLYGIKFEIVVFTNLTQDHLDFFKNMEEYKKAKLKLFNEFDYKYAVVNSDDPTGREIAALNKKAITYGIDNPSDVFALELCGFNNCTSFILNLFDRIFNVKINTIGKFNVSNALAAATVASLYGIKIEKVVTGLEMLKGVEGRLELVFDKEYTVYVDYAHTPDGLKNVLVTLRPLTKGKLICVFGCGGNRDVEKRKIMGKISGELADFTVITSDNPRFEEPMEIIWEIERGVLEKNKNYVIVEDRKEAINYAISMAKEGDTVLIAGKGCEKYQEVFGIKRFYNDKDTVEEIIRG